MKAQAIMAAIGAALLSHANRRRSQAFSIGVSEHLWVVGLSISRDLNSTRVFTGECLPSSKLHLCLTVLSWWKDNTRRSESGKA